MEKKSAVGVAILIAIVVVVLVVITFVKLDGDDDADGGASIPAVGDCINVTTPKAPTHTTLKCSDPKATYVVTADDGQCDKSETQYKTPTEGGNDDKDPTFARLCLGLNAKVGDCFEFTSSSEAKVGCAEKGPNLFKLTSIGKAGEQCASPAQPVEYPKRGTLLCFVPNA